MHYTRKAKRALYESSDNTLRQYLLHHAYRSRTNIYANNQLTVRQASCRVPGLLNLWGPTLVLMPGVIPLTDERYVFIAISQSMPPT